MTARGRLTRESIVQTAVRLADRAGLEGLTMRAVAAELGVEAMSLYHHVANKDALLGAMVDAVFDEITVPRPGAPWQAELRARTVSGRAVLLGHRWAVGLMDSRRDPGPATLRHLDATIGCLRTAGFSLALTGHAVALLDAFLYGFVLQELSLPVSTDVEIVELAEPILAGVGDELAWFTEYAVERAMLPGYRFADEFDAGLDLLLDAIARRRAAEV